MDRTQGRTPPRLLACDLDGTLLDRANTAATGIVALLAAARRAGIEVVLVTGRPPRWVWPAAAVLGHGGAAITAGGALTVRCGTRAVLSDRTLGADAARGLRERVLARWPGAGFAVETYDGLLAEPHAALRGSAIADAAPLDWAALADPVCKLICTPGAAATRGALAEALGGAADVHEMATDPPVLELRRPGVTKHDALDALCRDTGVEWAEVVAVGDERSDAPMLRRAGIGVALGDGHPDAIAAADVVTPPFRGDGAAAVLADLLGLDPPR